MSDIKIIDNTADNKSAVPMWGNKKKYIVVHYLGVVGQNNNIERSSGREGCGAQYYIYWDGTIYQAASDDAVLWQVGTAGGSYTQKHPEARNENCIGIEMCVKCDGDQSRADSNWYFTQETQEACIRLVKHLMEKYSIAQDHVLRHYDVVNKICPAPWVYNTGYLRTWTWEEFKSRLAQSLTKKEDTGVTITFKQIKAGYQGKEAGTMQRLLKADGYYKGKIDDSFGPASGKALKAWQKDHGLKADGVCGPASWTALVGI